MQRFLFFITFFLFSNIYLLAETITLKNSGTIKGRSFTIYKVNTKEGDILEIKLNSPNKFIFFNVREERTYEPLFIGHTELNPNYFKSKTLKDTWNEISVYFMRNEARREHIATYDLDINIISKEESK